MPYSKQLTAPNGAQLNFHKTLRFACEQPGSEIQAVIGSWPSEDVYLTGAPPVWTFYETLEAPPDVIAAIADLAHASPTLDGAVLVADRTGSLEVARVARIRELRQMRDAEINGGFVWDGSKFDSDQASQQRLLGALVAAQGGMLASVEWRLFDNSWRTLSAADLGQVYLALAQHTQAAFARFQACEEAVAAAETHEAIWAVQWEQDQAPAEPSSEPPPPQ